MHNIAERRTVTEATIAELREAAENDTKSSMGDKYETGREMAQQEMRKQQLALENLQEMEQTLKQIDPEEEHDQILLGTLIETDKGWFYVSVSLGKILVDKQEAFAVSIKAPLIKMFQTISVGETVSLNGQAYQMLSLS